MNYFDIHASHVIWAVHHVNVFFSQTQVISVCFLEQIHRKTIRHLGFIKLDICLFFLFWWECPEDQVWL